MHLLYHKLFRSAFLDLLSLHLHFIVVGILLMSQNISNLYLSICCTFLKFFPLCVCVCFRINYITFFWLGGGEGFFVCF